MMKIGFCAGTFDLFHVGHVLFLEKCKQNCDHLCVFVGLDEVVGRNKPNRPIIDEEARLKIVKSQKVVDEAYLFSGIPTDGQNQLEILEVDLKNWKEIYKKSFPCICDFIYFINDDREPEFIGEIENICHRLDIELMIMNRSYTGFKPYSTTSIIRKIQG